RTPCPDRARGWRCCQRRIRRQSLPKRSSPRAWSRAFVVLHCAPTEQGLCSAKKSAYSPRRSSAQRVAPSPWSSRRRMASPVEAAVQRYLQASAERDAAARAKLLEACFAEHGRMVTRSKVIHGRAGVDAVIARFLADPEMRGFRLTSAVDAAG